MEEKQTSCCSIFLITAVEKQFTIGNRTFQQTKSLSAVIKRSLHKICFIDQFKKITARPTLLHAAFFVVSSQCTFFTNTPLIMEFLFLMKVVKSCIIYKQGGIKTGFVIWNGTCGSDVTLEKKTFHILPYLQLSFWCHLSYLWKHAHTLGRDMGVCIFFIMMLSLHIACKNYYYSLVAKEFIWYLFVFHWQVRQLLWLQACVYNVDNYWSEITRNNINWDADMEGNKDFFKYGFSALIFSQLLREYHDCT